VTPCTLFLRLWVSQLTDGVMVDPMGFEIIFFTVLILNPRNSLVRFELFKIILVLDIGLDQDSVPDPIRMDLHQI
jgi:hypothetical protein